MNQVIMTGNLTKDPQKIQTNSGEPLTKFTIAVNESDETLFMDCLTFKNTATNCFKYLTKGSKILIQGKLQLNEYESNGKKYSRPEVITHKVEFLSSKKNDNIESDMPFPEVDKPVDPNDDLPF